MGHDKPHEPDQARDRHARGGHERGKGQQDRPLAGDVHAQVRGRLLAQQEPVERPRPEEDQEAAAEDQRCGDREAEPGRAVKAAEQVREDLPEARPGHVHRHREARRQQRAHGISGEEQRGERSERAGPRQPVDDRDGAQGAHECEAVEEAELQDEPTDRQDHGDGRAERRTRGGAQHVGIRERVPQEPLECGPGDGEASAHDHRRQDPRQPQVHHDRLGRGGPGDPEVQAEEALGEDRDGRPGRQVHGPEPDPADEDDGERDGPNDRQARRAPRSARGDGEEPGPCAERDGGGGHGGYGAGDGRTRSGWMASASARMPSARRGPGRVTMTSSIGLTSPDFTAVSTSQPGRWPTASTVTP